jgi:hypothetical protein
MEVCMYLLGFIVRRDIEKDVNFSLQIVYFGMILMIRPSRFPLFFKYVNATMCK